MPRLLDSALLLQGVTGFGSSIALLSTWVVSRAIGIRACERPHWLLDVVIAGSHRNMHDKQTPCVAGTFEQLVLTDSLSALVASPPLLYVTNAKKFCDWRLVFTAVTFQVITADCWVLLDRTDMLGCMLHIRQNAPHTYML